MVEHKPMATQGGYGASKMALRAATKHLALELGKRANAAAAKAKALALVSHEPGILQIMKSISSPNPLKYAPIAPR